MKAIRLSIVIAVAVFVLSPLQAQDQRAVPAREIPLPSEASSQLQALIRAGGATDWDTHPQTAAEWKTWIEQKAAKARASLPALREKLHVTVTPTTIAGVHVFDVRPQDVPSANRRRILIHFHGGGYVLNPGEAGTAEAVMMAGLGGFRVISVDYRMPPDSPYPAALDDAVSVYRVLAKEHPSSRIGVFGTSTGGALALAMTLRAKAEGLPLPAAIGAGTPWSDLAKIGDSYFTNDRVDDVLVRYEGWLGDAAKLYAGGHDLKDPYLSPVYGDYRGFPPTMLVTGTRDLFLSNTIRVHDRIRSAGSQADLVVFEGVSHAQYLLSPDLPEGKKYFGGLASFFDAHLKR